WYDGQHPADARRLAPQAGLKQLGLPPRVYDQPDDPFGPTLVRAVSELRRRKDADEIDLLRRCMRATDAGHAWARTNVEPGMTELDVYCGVNSACIRDAGQAVIVYG